MLKTSRQSLNRFSTLIKASVAGAAISIGLVFTANAGDAKRGESLAQTCMGCHGAPGLRNPGPVYDIPMVGGQHPEYIVAALKDYKDKKRSHATMQAQAASLSEQDMQDIAAYFASISDNTRPGAVTKSLIAKGKEKAAMCASCHGATGDGANVIYPKLAGQYQSYMIQALKDYRSGERENIIMNTQVKTLTIRDIKALSAYFASQEGGLSAPESTLFK